MNAADVEGLRHRSSVWRTHQSEEAEKKTKAYAAAVRASYYIDPEIENENVLPPERQFHESFTMFRKLPVEIRLKIWRFSILAPRLVQIRAQKKLVVFSELDAAARWDRFVGRSWAIPQVCKEPREEALRLGSKPCFEGRLKGPVFFDGHKDTLLISADVLSWFMKPKGFGLGLSQFREDSVKFLAIYPYSMSVHLDNDLRYSEGHGIDSEQWRTIFSSFRAFGGLEEVCFVVEKKENLPIDEVKEEFREFVEKRYEKEKRIWDMIREMHNRECRRYVVPTIIFLTTEELKTRRNIPI